MREVSEVRKSSSSLANGEQLMRGGGEKALDFQATSAVEEEEE